MTTWTICRDTGLDSEGRRTSMEVAGPFDTREEAHASIQILRKGEFYDQIHGYLSPLFVRAKYEPFENYVRLLASCFATPRARP